MIIKTKDIFPKLKLINKKIKKIQKNMQKMQSKTHFIIIFWNFFKKIIENKFIIIPNTIPKNKKIKKQLSWLKVENIIWKFS